MRLLAEEGCESRQVELCGASGLARTSSARGASARAGGAGDTRRGRSRTLTGRGRGEDGHLPAETCGIHTLLQPPHRARHARLAVIDLLEERHVSADGGGEGAEDGKALEQMLDQGIALLQLIHSRLRQRRSRSREHNARCHASGKGGGGGAERLAEVDLGTEGRHKGAKLACIGLKALGLKAVGEGAMHRVAHPPGVVMGGNAGVRRGDGEGVAARQGGGGAGGGEGQRVAAEGVGIGGVGIGDARLELLELIQQIICCLLSTIECAASTAAGTAAAATAGTATAAATIAAVAVTAIATVAATMAASSWQFFNLQKVESSRQISCDNRILQRGEVSRTHDGLQRLLKGARSRIRRGFDESGETRGRSSRSRRNRSRRCGGRRRGRACSVELGLHRRQSSVDLLLPRFGFSSLSCHLVRHRGLHLLHEGHGPCWWCLCARSCGALGGRHRK